MRNFSLKNIVILTSSGGGGHICISSAITTYLQDKYHIKSIAMFNDLLLHLDPINIFTFGKYTSENFYNFLIQKNLTFLISLFFHGGSWLINFRKKRIRNILSDYLKKNKCDLIISVIPIINNIVLDVAQDLNIPFLLIPADLDVRTYLNNIKDQSYEKFYIAPIFDHPRIIQPIIDANISINHIIPIGALLRSNFFEPKDVATLKQEFKIPHNVPVAMILMGNRGSTVIKKYVKELSNIQQPIHIIACLGTYNNLQAEIMMLPIPKHITISLIDHTDRVADFMAVSDILLSKSGSLSVCEAIYMNVPLCLDATHAVLPWELFNHLFVEEQNFGKSIRAKNEIIYFVSSLLKNKEKLDFYKNNLENFPKKNSRIELIALVKKILE